MICGEGKIDGSTGRGCGGPPARRCLAVPVLLAPAASASTGDIIAPSDPHNPQVDSGWQAGTCEREPPESGAELCSVATPDQFFETRRRPPELGLHPVHRQATSRTVGPGETPVGELKTRPGRPPGRAQRQPRRDRALPARDLRSRRRRLSRRAPRSAKAAVTASVPPLGLPIAAGARVTQVPVYNVEPANGQPARFGLELAGNEVFLEGDVAWAGDFHEGFTIHVPDALPTSAADRRADPEKPPGLRRPLRRRHLHHHPQHLPRRSRTGAVGHALLDLPAGRAPTRKRKAPATNSPQSAHRPSSRRSRRAPRRKECNTIPYDPALAVDPGTAADRLSRRRRGRRHRSPHPRRPDNAGQLEHPHRRR